MRLQLIAINSKYIHSNPAVYSLRAYAVHQHPEFRENIKITEYTINNRREEILAAIFREKPDVMAFSCYIWNIEMVRALLPELHKLMPEVPIYLGGPEVSYDAQKLLKEIPYLTGIMVGEGEVTFTELLEYYMGQKSNLRDIRGMWIQSGFTGERELTNLKELPFFYDDLSVFQNRILYYESQRGCPFRCSYCLSSIDKKTRFRNLELVKKELAFFLEHQVPQVKFVDRTFNCNHEHCQAIWRYIQEHDNGITNFHFEIAADVLNEEEMTILSQMRPGLVQLEVGVQTTNEDTLREIDRYVHMDHIKAVVERLREKENMHIHLDLIAGLPLEDYDSFVHSFNEVYYMKPEQLQLGFLKVLKGSKMHDMAKEYGILYTDSAPFEVLQTKWLSYEEILSLKEVEEMVEQYYNSNQYVHSISVMAEEFPTPFSFYRALADYYKEKGYVTNSPSRMRRYEILLEFMIQHNQNTANSPDRENLYRELLVHDLYLREKLKARPAFSPEYTVKQPNKMTHTEQYHYAVWKYGKEAAAMLKQPVCIEYDYTVRNPLNHDAAITLPVTS